VKRKSNRDYTVQMYDHAWYLDKFSRHECCDCSLVHETEWKVENGRLFTRWKRAEKETKDLRKKLGIKVTRATKD
jgi:hypothetical protein